MKSVYCDCMGNIILVSLDLIKGKFIHEIVHRVEISKTGSYVHISLTQLMNLVLEENITYIGEL